MKYVLSVLLLAVVGLIGYDYSQTREMAHRPAPVVSEQLPRLPEDGKAYYFTVFLCDKWAEMPACREVKSWVETNQKLVSLKAQTHYHLYTSDDPMFIRYKGSIKEFPCVVLQRADGKCLYKMSGSNVPKTASGLADALIKTFPTTQGYCLRGRGTCPYVKPQPAPQPAPVVPDTVAPFVPDTIISPPPEESEGLPTFVVLGLLVAGGAAAIGPKVIQKYKALG